MVQLPRWVLTNPIPAVLDTESVTAIEMVAKLYGAMQGLIDEYNAFAERTEKSVNDFMNDSNADREVFQIAMRQEFQDFIDVIDVKVTAAESYMRTNLREIAEQYLAGIINEFNDQILDFNETKTLFEQRFEEFLVNSNATIQAQNSSISTALANMDQRLGTQDAKVDEAYAYLQTNLQSNLEQAVADALNNGDIAISYIYDEATESLTFVATQGGV